MPELGLVLDFTAGTAAFAVIPQPDDHKVLLLIDMTTKVAARFRFSPEGWAKMVRDGNSIPLVVAGGMPHLPQPPHGR
jgi:hypothetical protein